MRARWATSREGRKRPPRRPSATRSCPRGARFEPAGRRGEHEEGEQRGAHRPHNVRRGRGVAQNNRSGGGSAGGFRPPGRPPPLGGSGAGGGSRRRGSGGSGGSPSHAGGRCLSTSV